MSATTAADTNLLGRVVLGRYRVLRHLAQGGMGAIYLARNEGSSGFMRPVVIKCILPSRVGDEELIKLFVREARIMAGLRHPGIVSIIDFAEDEGVHMMVMEYVHGFHLGRWHKFLKRRGRKFPVEMAIHVVLHVLRALDYAHKLRAADGSPLDIVHRDVTPSNVLISAEGHIKLADFGIARTAQEHTDVGGGVIKGKFPYLAPEILQGGEPTPVSDVYSAGLILHELLVGKNEFLRDDVGSTIGTVLNHIPTAVAQVRQVPRGLADVVAKSLAKLPESRYQSAVELATALAKVRSQSEDECAAKLAEMVSRDFNDPEMARLFKLPLLNALEADWTTPAGGHVVPDAQVGAVVADDTPSSQGRELVSDTGGGSVPDAPTEIHAMTPGPTPAPAAATGKRSPLPWIVAAAGSVAAAVAITVMVMNRGGDTKGSDAPVIVVSDRLDRTDPAPPVPEPVAPQPVATIDAGATAPVPTPEPTARAPRKPRKPMSAADRLNRAFAAQRAQISRCFDQHAAGVTGTPALSLRVRVETDGRVSSAELIPGEIAATPLGSCIIGVARRAKLGAQDKAITFRVPIKARVN